MCSYADKMAAQENSSVATLQPSDGAEHLRPTSHEALVADRSDDALRLVITNVDHLFNAPPVNPLSAGLPERLGMAGVEYLVQQLEIRSWKHFTKVRLVAPEDILSSSMAGQVTAGLQSYAAIRVPQQEALLRETRHHGWRLTGAATLLLAMFLALSSLFASEWTEGLRPLLRKTLEYGFEIVGWVMLWHPIEVLVFQPIAIRTRIKALRSLMELDVVTEALTEESRLPFA